LSYGFGTKKFVKDREKERQVLKLNVEIFLAFISGINGHSKGLAFV